MTIQGHRLLQPGRVELWAEEEFRNWVINCTASLGFQQTLRGLGARREFFVLSEN